MSGYPDFLPEQDFNLNDTSIYKDEPIAITRFYNDDLILREARRVVTQRQRTEAATVATLATAVLTDTIIEAVEVYSNQTRTIGQELADRLVVETGVPECSIAASDIANLAFERLFSDEKPKQTRQRKVLFLGEEEFCPTEKDIKLLATDKSLLSGYVVNFGLASDKPKKRKLFTSKKDDPDESLTLYAITRGDIALPLVRFKKSSDGSYCDYLQFYGEEDMDELESSNFYGWGQDDNGSRFEAVKLVGDLIKGRGDPLKLSSVLRIDNRIESVMGPSDSGVERVMTQVFTEFDEDVVHVFNQEFNGVNFSKVGDSNLTMSGTLSKTDDNPLVRKIAVQIYPSSQRPDNFPTQVIIADKRRGFYIVEEDGEQKPITSFDLKTIKTLIGSQDYRTEQTTTDSKWGGAFPTFKKGWLVTLDNLDTFASKTTLGEAIEYMDKE